ncbi:hypothetical protein JQK15_03870 [Sphingobium sp. BHU LFT2]|uniref:hypothetical protein n=1 Tax=Sphingobium sp. BHU LFT2 TaxID=2807634 RepID=UPI001BE78E63|nr:hypothetical protein [Sphingobium sp. BHU LFT2]MBT2242666.1 hypothetical protein [Sphingobium sp. BHU LFT2]
MNDRWCILRMSGGSTVSVVTSLTEAGFDAWTPIAIEKRQAPRSKRVREISFPITPGIAFARADRLHDLVVMSRAPVLTSRRYNRESGRMEQRGCPYFSVFRDQGHYPLIADHTLDPLRKAEHRGRRRPKVERPLVVGEKVRRLQTAFGGLIGVVMSVNKRAVEVVFEDGTNPFTFDMCHLEPVDTVA